MQGTTQAISTDNEQHLATLPDALATYWTTLPEFIKNPTPNIFLSDNYVYVDFETTNLDKGSPVNPENRLILAAWKLGEGHPDYIADTTYYCWGSEFEQRLLAEVCEKAEFIVAHNAKFELGWLRRMGCNTNDMLAYCTQVGEYVRAGNRQWRLSLEESLRRYGLPGKESLVSGLIKAGVCPSEIPKNWLQRYCIQDVVAGHDLFRLQRVNINENGLLPTQFTRCIFTPVLEDLERVGMHLDAERVEIVCQKYNDKLVELQAQMDELTGGINTRSPIQKAHYFYNVLKFPIPTDFRGNELRGKKPKNPKSETAKYFPEGVPTTDSKYTAKFKAKTKKQRRFLELLSELNKVKDAKSKALDKFLACITETEDHVLNAQFNQTVTGTHRLSSSGTEFKVQFQNFARIFKPLFSPRNPGWKIGETDEGQLEYRAAVFLGRDEAGLRDIQNKVDAHGFTASIIFREQWEECGGDKNTPLGKRVRTDSKEHTFKPLYGGKSGTPREREYYEAFRLKHRDLTKTQDEWLKEVYQTRKLKTITGLVFYWEDAKMNRKGKLIRPDGRPVDQSVCNYPVQSLATAEIVPIAVTCQWHLMRVAQMQSFLINTVHDSSIGEVHPDEEELYKEIGEFAMTDYAVYFLKQVYDIDFDIPLEAEPEFNDFWSDSEYWKEEFLA